MALRCALEVCEGGILENRLKVFCTTDYSLVFFVCIYPFDHGLTKGPVPGRKSMASVSLGSLRPFEIFDCQDSLIEEQSETERQTVSLGDLLGLVVVSLWLAALCWLWNIDFCRGCCRSKTRGL